MKAAAFLLVPAAALVLQSCLPAGVTLPQSPVLKWLERKSGRIAFVALDGNVRTIDQAGAAQKDVTADASVSEDGSGVSYFYQFPAWSPDGRRLAFVGVRRTSQAVMDTGVWTAASEGKLPVRVFSGDGRMPRFLSWAPDSSRLVFVASAGDRGEQLETVPAGGGTVRTLDEGSAFAWRWKNGAVALAVHSVKDATGETVERVSILDPRGASAGQDLGLVPGGFEAPAWSADGQGIFMAVSENEGSTLYLEDRGGTGGRPLAQLDGDATIDLSPDGTRLAWAAPVKSGEAPSRALYIIDLPGGRPPAAGSATPQSGGSPPPLTGDDFVAAFFWSPDGTKIAYFVMSSTPGDNGPDHRMTLKILNVRTGAVRTVASFHPNPYFDGLLQEFGQYAESERLWSPDSRYILYCAQEPDSFDIMVAYADQPIAPRKIADGLMATWSPR